MNNTKPENTLNSSFKGQPKFNLKGFAFWNVYFFIKFYLFFLGTINFHLLENIAFALFLLIPTNNRLSSFIHHLLAAVFAVTLLYYDSWLPNIEIMVKQATNLDHFDIHYLIELASRLITIKFIAVLFIVLFSYSYLRYYLKLSVISVLIMCVIGIQQYNPTNPITALNTDITQVQDSSATSPEQHLRRFYRLESERVIDYSSLKLATNFDILILNICSLSWDDLRLTGLDNHPIFKKFDLLFTRFNSATSYSGPAAIRLLRASCGQTKHDDLYQATSQQCYLFENLKKLGFDHQLIFNHDGNFDKFEQNVRLYGGWKTNKIPFDDIPIAQYAFDGSPIYNDKALFAKWFSTQHTQPLATFYNTVSLHDGNKLIGQKQHIDSLENYHPRVLQLLNDLNDLFTTIEKSNRKVLLIMIPEHGAALSGDKLQISGMREFPSPSITLVPVGIKYFGTKFLEHKTQIINKPTSYLAISSLIQRTISKDIFSDGEKDIDLLIENLPTTEHVAENESSIVMKYNNKYLLKVGDEDWIPYP
jgi:cellulose synthase operon protein YhjU